MKEYIGYVTRHFKETFNLRFLIFTIIVLSVAIYFNYKFDFEDGYIDKGNTRSEIRIVYFFLFQGAIYLIACLGLGFTKQNWSWVRSKGFWLTFVFGFLMLSVNRSFYYQIYLEQFFDHEISRFSLRIIRNFRWILTMLIPMWFFYQLYDKKHQTDFYGIRRNEFKLKPYLIMYAVMIPLTLRLRLQMIL